VIDSLYAVAQTLRISVPTVLDSIVGRSTLARCDERLDDWSHKLVARAGIDLHVHGADAVDWSRRYVVMSNHQSHYDIPVLYRVVRGRMRMITKAELFRIPIFGKAMREAGFVEIDRGHRDRAIASLREAARQIAEGTHIWIAPEGTRSRTGELGPLKKGGFVLARDAGAPILPIAIDGTVRVLPRGGKTIVRRQRVDVTVGQPIETAGATTEQLMQAVGDFLVTTLARKR
jgi:1-acyl-sn-glycerol-3-phosphate acyltransferase